MSPRTLLLSNRVIVLFHLIQVTMAKFNDIIHGDPWPTTAANTQHITDLCHSNGTVCFTDPANWPLKDHANLQCETIVAVTNYLDGFELANPEGYARSDAKNSAKLYLGIFLYGRYDPTIPGNQSVAVSLSSDNPIAGDILHVCTQDNYSKNRIFGTWWKLNDKLVPDKKVLWPERAPVNMDLDGVQYFGCQWGIADLETSNLFHSSKFKVHLAKVNLVQLEDGGLILKKWLHANSVVKLDGNYHASIGDRAGWITRVVIYILLILVISLVCNLVINWFIQNKLIK